MVSAGTWYNVTCAYKRNTFARIYVTQSGSSVGSPIADQNKGDYPCNSSYTSQLFFQYAGGLGANIVTYDDYSVWRKGMSQAEIDANCVNVTQPSPPDTTPPTAPPYVYDGTGADISSTTSTTQLSANWGYSTATSSVSAYYFSVGTIANGTSIESPTNIGNYISTTTAGLSLSVGTTYYFNVYAIAGNGITGSTTTSNGQFVYTLPVASSVYPPSRRRHKGDR
jgi:hypothetical protein